VADEYPVKSGSPDDVVLDGILPCRNCPGVLNPSCQYR
jgi:hypothetical protein